MEIQPRSFGDSLGDLITMLGKVWRPLLLPALVTSVLAAAASYVVLASGDALDFLELTFTNPEAIESMTDDQLFDQMVGFFGSFLWVGLVSSLFYGFLYMAASRAVGEVYAEQPSTRSLVGVALGLMLSWVVAALLTIVGATVGFLLLFLPGIWFVISVSLIAPVLAVEEVGPLGAIKRSIDLVKGNWWETVGFILLIGVIGGTASQLIQLVALPLLLVGDPGLFFGLTIAASVAVQGLIIAAIAVGISVWYFNLRARTDGPFTLRLS